MGLSLEMTTASARSELEALQKSITKTGTDVSAVKVKMETLGKTVSNMAKAFEAAGDKASAKNYRDLKREIDSVYKSISELKKGMGGVDSGAKKTAKSIETVSKSTEYANKSLETHKKTIEKVTSSSEKYIKKIKEQKDELARSEKATKSATKTAASYDLQLSENMETAKKTNKQIDLLSEKNKKLAKTNQSLGGTVSYLKTQTQELKRQLSSTNTELFRSGKANLDLQKKISTVTNQIQKHKKENKELKGELSSLRGESTRLKADVVSLTSAYWKQGKTIINLQKNNSSLTNQLRKTKTELQSAVKTARLYDAELARLMRQNERLVKSNEKYKESIKKIRNEQRSMHDSMNKIMKIASTFRNVMFLGSIAMSWKYLAQDIIKVGSEFELLMKQVGAASGAIEKGFVSADFEKLRDLALKLGETTEYTSIQSAEAMKHLAMAGFNTRQMYATLPGVLDLATAGQIELGEAAEFATGALTSMGLITADTTQLTKNLERVNNALVFSAVQTNVSVQDLAESFKYVAPQAKNMGMSIEDLTLWLGILGNSNIKASAAGTQMSFALMRQAKAMKALGMSVVENDFLDMIKMMNKEGWGAEKINEVFTARGSRMILSIKSMVPVFEKLRDAQKDAGNYAKELAEIMRDSTTVNFQKFASLVNNIKIEGFNQGSKNLNSSLKGLYTTVTLNRKELEKVAKAFVDTASFAMDFVGGIIDATKAIKDFYVENQSLVEVLLAGASAWSLWKGHIVTGSLLGIGTFGLHQMMEQTKDTTDEVINLTRELANLVEVERQLESERGRKPGKGKGDTETEAKTRIARVTSNIVPIYAPESMTKNAIGELSLAKIKSSIDKTGELLSSKKERMMALAFESDSFLMKVMKNNESLAMAMKKDMEMTKTFATEFFAGTRESSDILQRAIDEMSSVEDDMNKLGNFKGKIGAKKDGTLKYVGGQTLEDQKNALKKTTQDKIDDLKNSIEIYSKSAKEYTDKYYELLPDFEALGPKPDVLTSTEAERENWNALSTELDKHRTNAEQYTASALTMQNTLDKAREKSAMEGSMLDKQISERNYNNLKAGIDAVRNSENDVLNIKKQYFEEYGSWSLKEWKRYNDEEIDAKIKAQKEKISDLQISYNFQDPDKRMEIGKFKEMLSLENQRLSMMKKNAKIEKEIEARRKAEDVRRTEYDAMKDSENALYDMKKSNYESYQTWSAAKTKEFRKKEIKKEIDAQVEVLRRFDEDWKNRVGGLSDEQYKKLRIPEQSKLDELNRSKPEKELASSLETANTQIQIATNIYDINKELDDKLFDQKRKNAEKLDFFFTKNADDFYKQELERAVKAEEKKLNLWLETEFYKSKSDPMKLNPEQVGQYVEKSIQYIKGLKDDIANIGNDIGITFGKSMGEGLKSAITSSLTGVLEDALGGELKNFSDYFKSIVDSMKQVWANAVVEMAMTYAKNMMMANTAATQSQQGGAALGGFAGMGGLAGGLVAGGAIFAASSILSSREAKKAEKARKTALRQQLSSELGDSIASLELSDAGYQIYQLNDRIEELTEQAKDAGYPMDQIIKLRKLETEEILKNIKAQYESASQSMTDFVTGVIREDWSLADWQAQYDKLHNDLLALDENGINYQEDSIDILNQQFEALQEIYNIQKDQLNALEGLNDSLTSQIWGLQNTDNSPTSLTNFKAKYESLRALATTPVGGFLNEDAISDFQDFVQEYIDVFSSAGYDYKDILNGNAELSNVIGDLTSIQGDVQSESAKLTEAIKNNTTALSGEEGVINAITNLAKITQDIANREVYKAWKEAAPIIPKIEDYKQKNFSMGYYESLKTEVGGNGPDDVLPLLGIYHKQVEAQKVIDWASMIDGGISPEVEQWKKDIIASFDLLDIDSAVEAYKNGSYGEYANEVQEDYKKLFDLVSNIPAFAKGGYATTPSIAGEAGPEWVVPAYNNPNNENFLKSVGMDSGVIGSQIGVIVADKVSKAIYNALSNMTLNSDNQGDIVVKINEKEIARATLSQMKNNPSEYKRVLQ